MKYSKKLLRQMIESDNYKYQILIHMRVLTEFINILNRIIKSETRMKKSYDTNYIGIPENRIMYRSFKCIEKIYLSKRTNLSSFMEYYSVPAYSEKSKKYWFNKISLCKKCEKLNLKELINLNKEK